MLTVVQQHAIDRFAKNLLALNDDALIDTYHQAAEDNRAARAEGSDNLSKAHAQTLAAEKAMRDRFHDYRTRYNARYPCKRLLSLPLVTPQPDTEHIRAEPMPHPNRPRGVPRKFRYPRSR